MTKPIRKQHSKNQTILETENTSNLPPEKPIPPENPVEATSTAIKPNPDNTPENQDPMEVHTHGHIHETKKWKEYMFQFIMLFLAVSLSFLVENEREHYIENERAEVLAASLVQDLKADLKEIDRVVGSSDTIIMANNALIAELNKPRALQNDSLIHLYGLQRIARFNVFDPSSGNYDQVKYSGALRYFKPIIVNELTAYETNKNYLLKMANTYMNFHIMTLTPFCLQNSNPRFIDAITNKTPIPQPVFSKPPTAEFLDQIYRYALYVNARNKQQVLIVKNHGLRTRELIRLLTENYELGENPETTEALKKSETKP